MRGWGVRTSLIKNSRPALTLWLWVLLAPLAHGDLYGNALFELNLNGGYTDNLLSDSSALVDRYSVSSATVRFYPTSKIEFNATGEATFYDRESGLTNRMAKAGAVMMPLSPESRFSIYLDGNFNLRRYRIDYRQFNNNNLDARVAFGYKLGSATSCRIGATIQSAEYLGSQDGDKATREMYAGLNATLPGKSSLDLEIGYSTMNYRYVDPHLDFIDHEHPEAALVSGTLKSLYVSPRWSCQLGRRTGVTVTYSFRSFIEDDDRIVYGSSVGLLSPWTGVWEGNSVTASVKSYVIPRSILSAGCGYWSRRHLRTIESDQFPLVMGRSRSDDQVRIYAQIVRPILFTGGRLLQPRIQIDFVRNNSTNELFDYSGFSISTGLSLRL